MMVVGHIDEDWQAIVPLVVTQEGCNETLHFLIDTGFTGFLAVPRTWVEQLGLPVRDVQRGMTADGRVAYFETVDVTIVWHAEPRVIRAQVLEEPLIGTRLLRFNQATIRWESGSTFEIHR